MTPSPRRSRLRGPLAPEPVRAGAEGVSISSGKVLRPASRRFTLLQAWPQNQMTATFVVTVLDYMGEAAAPALPQLRTEITKTRRGGRFGTIDTDEDLMGRCQKIIAYLE